MKNNLFNIDSVVSAETFAKVVEQLRPIAKLRNLNLSKIADFKIAFEIYRSQLN